MKGCKFEKWTVIGDPVKVPNYEGKKVKCQCECGTKRMVSVTRLKNNLSRSCGCTAKQKHSFLMGGLTIKNQSGIIKLQDN